MYFQVSSFSTHNHFLRIKVIGDRTFLKLFYFQMALFVAVFLIFTFLFLKFEFSKLICNTFDCFDSYFSKTNR